MNGAGSADARRIRQPSDPEVAAGLAVALLLAYVEQECGAPGNRGFGDQSPRGFAQIPGRRRSFRC